MARFLTKFSWCHQNIYNDWLYTLATSLDRVHAYDWWPVPAERSLHIQAQPSHFPVRSRSDFDSCPVCLVDCIYWCSHHGMQWRGVWLLSTKLYACEVCVWLSACRCRARLARYSKHPRLGSPGASKLVASLESCFYQPGSCSQAT
jgi:hypothetical protein